MVVRLLLVLEQVDLLLPVCDVEPVPVVLGEGERIHFGKFWTLKSDLANRLRTLKLSNLATGTTSTRLKFLPIFSFLDL